MALIKADLVESIREKIRFRKKKKDRQQYLFPEMDYDFLSRKRAEKLVDSTLELIKQALERGEDLIIYGFGRFKVRFRWPRKGRNPVTGEQIVVSSHRVVAFHCSPAFKEKLNTRKGGIGFRARGKTRNEHPGPPGPKKSA
jgi:integration host factor subunit alpha